MRIDTPAVFISLSTAAAIQAGEDPFDTGDLEEMRKEDIAPYTNQRFSLNLNVPNLEVARHASNEHHGGWQINNNLANTRYPFITLKRSAARQEQKSVGDKLHISVNQKDVPKAFEVMGKLINSQESPINSWKVTDIARIDPRDTRLSQGAQFTLYPKPDLPDGSYSPKHIGKINALVRTLEQSLAAQGIEKSEHKPASDVSAPQWEYASYRNEFRSDRQGSSSQSTALKEEPFFKLVSYAQ